MADVQLTQSTIIVATERIASGTQLTQSTIIVAVRRYPVTNVLRVGPPWGIPKPKFPPMPVLY